MVKKTSDIVKSTDSKALTLDNVQTMVENAKNEIQEQAKISEAEFKIEIEKLRKELDSQAQNSQASFMTILGIFASFISFLTIEFQFLKYLENIYQVIGFTLILFSLLLSFNIGLDYLIKTRLNQETPKPHYWFYITIFLTFALGILFIFISSNH